MSISLFQTVLTVALLLPFSTVPFAPSPRQSMKRDSASGTINPAEATAHVGQRGRLKPSLKALTALQYDGRLKSATAGA
jgi:hypothetical protein